MKIVKMKKHTSSSDAIEMLEIALEKAKSGEYQTCAISWVDSEGSIGGEISSGGDVLKTWAALEHSARSFYNNQVCG